MTALSRCINRWTSGMRACARGILREASQRQRAHRAHLNLAALLKVRAALVLSVDEGRLSERRRLASDPIELDSRRNRQQPRTPSRSTRASRSSRPRARTPSSRPRPMWTPGRSRWRCRRRRPPPTRTRRRRFAASARRWVATIRVPAARAGSTRSATAGSDEPVGARCARAAAPDLRSGPWGRPGADARPAFDDDSASALPRDPWLLCR
jgi:hypothetical protein